MNPYMAELLAKELINQYLYNKGWVFRFNNPKKIFGRCSYIEKTIYLSKPLTILNDEHQVKDTLLHEIAHALTPGASHNWRWKAKCLDIGAKPERCYDTSKINNVAGNYGLYCPMCDIIVEERHRRTQGIRIHRSCNTEVEWVAYG